MAALTHREDTLGEQNQHWARDVSACKVEEGRNDPGSVRFSQSGGAAAERQAVDFVAAEKPLCPPTHTHTHSPGSSE